jgi:hypothetical protein
VEVVRAWAALEIRRRWRSLAVLALLVTVGAGAVLTAVAGARRGESAVDRLWSAGTRPATAAVVTERTDVDWAAVAALPQVEAIGTFCGTTFQVDGVPSDLDPVLIPCDDRLARTVERPLLLAGRMFDPARDDEVVVSTGFLRESGRRVGDVLTGRLYSAAQIATELAGERTGPMDPQGPVIPMRIVGVIRSPYLRDSPSGFEQLVASPGLARRHPAEVGAARRNALVRLRGGEAALPAFQAAVLKVTGEQGVFVWNLPERYRHDAHLTWFEARCLLALAGGMLLASAVLVGQAAARTAGAVTAGLAPLRACGLTRGPAVAAGMVVVLPAAVAGTVAGALLAALASRWFPIGSASLIEPRPGAAFDLLVLPVGGLAALLVVVAGAVLGAFPAARPAVGRRPSRSGLAAAGARLGLPVPVQVGSRYALERGAGRAAVPVRPALLGAVVGLLGVCGALTFGAAVQDAGRNPARFGQTHQLVALAGLGGEVVTGSPGTLRAGLERAARVAGVAGVNDTRVAVASSRQDVPVPLRTFDPVGAGIDPVLTAGRMPRAAHEVVLAPDTVTALGTRIGGRVTLSGVRGERELTVVGTGLLPVAFQYGYSTGGWVTPAGLGTLFDGYDFRLALLQVRPGRAPASVVAAADAAAGPLQFLPPKPVEQLNEVRRVQGFPVALAVFLVLLAVLAVGHGLAVAVRGRRGELAVLRALGMTPRQTGAVVAVQGTVLAVIGFVAGAPLGVAAGRLVWRVVADFTPLAYAPPRSRAGLAVILLVALLVALLLAALPGRRAARLPIAPVLRTE